MRLLITGAGGQLGIDLVRCCEAAGDDVVATGHADLDVADRDAVHGAVSMLRPDVVINCAAWTAVDACEGDPDRALAQNGSPFAIAELRQRGHAWQISLVRVSLLDRPYTNGTTRRQSVYERASWRGRAVGAGQSAAVGRLAVCVNGSSRSARSCGWPTSRAGLRPTDRSSDVHTTWHHGSTIAVERRNGVHHVTNQTPTGLVRSARRRGSDGQNPDMVQRLPASCSRRGRHRALPTALDNAVFRSRHPLARLRRTLLETVNHLST
jgi:dTDP-4-dehydrorhamnose reductase